jgi:hypothetical protein
MEARVDAQTWHVDDGRSSRASTGGSDRRRRAREFHTGPMPPKPGIALAVVAARVGQVRAKPRQRPANIY